jgi:hypothetical protein
MKTMMPTCAQRFLPVRNQPVSAATPSSWRRVDGVEVMIQPRARSAATDGLWHCFFAGPIGGFGRVLAEAVVAGRAAHATPCLFFSLGHGDRVRVGAARSERNPSKNSQI